MKHFRIVRRSRFSSDVAKHQNKVTQRGSGKPLTKAYLEKASSYARVSSS